MGAIKGYSSNQKDDRLSSETVCVEPVSPFQDALTTNARIGAYSVGSDAVEAGSTTSVIVAASHAARRGDIIRFTSGDLNGYEAIVASTATNSITLGATFSVSPDAGDTFSIFRHKAILLSSDGTLAVSVTGEVAVAASFPDYGEIAFGDLTTSFESILDSPGDVTSLVIDNATNAAIIVSLDGGTGSPIKLTAGGKLTLDFRTNARFLTNPDIQVKYVGSAPSSGSVIVMAVV